MTETLWTKDGSFPGALPDVAYDGEGLSYTDLANSPDARALTGWIEAPPEPEFDPATEQLGWDGEGWTIEPKSPVAPEPIRIKKFWLFERFTEDQERRYAKLEYQARNLTPAELDDPAKEPLFQIQRFDRRLGAIEFVELNAPQTLGVFELLRQLGVFGDPEDPASSAAVAAILAPPEPHEVI